jgi:thiol-disulfide isomerase/thioredoxin
MPWILLGVLSILNIAGASVSPMPGFIAQCGSNGKNLYANCDRPKLNQLTMLEKTKALAKQSGGLTIIIFGAEWCLPCLQVEAELRLLKSELETKGHQVVKINMSTVSGRDAKLYLDLSFKGIPHLTAIGSGGVKIFDESELGLRENGKRVSLRGFVEKAEFGLGFGLGL